MKRILALIALFAFSVGCASDRWRAKTLESVSNAHSKVFEVSSILFGKDVRVKKFRLTNGLQIVVMEDHSAPVFAYHTWFNVGSRNEKDGTTGIAHLFEHLMFKETKNQPEGAFDRMLEEQGGRVNAATYLDWTFYRESLPSPAFHLIPALEADRMQNMILNDKQVNSEREVVANERRFRTDNSPSGQMYESLYAEAFKAHPYHWPVVGWMKDIHAITTQDCIKFHSTYYAPNNATLVVVGDVETDDVLRRINDAYGRIPPSHLPSETLPAEPKQTAERRVKLDLTVPSEKLIVAYKSVNSDDGDFAPLQLLNSILYDGRSSRLYRRLVTDGQIASEAGSWVNQTKDPGLFIMDITMRPERKASEAEKVIYEELEKLAKEIVPARELEKAKNRLETSFWQGFRTADDKAQALGFYETVERDYRHMFNEVPRYQAVTAAEVQRVAKSYFGAEGRTVVVAYPQKSGTSKE
jgi:zinc protease